MHHCGTCELAINEEPYFCSGIPYHHECTRCLICGKSPFDDNSIEELTCIIPGIFLCPLHHSEYILAGRRVPDLFVNKFREKIRRKIVRESFRSQSDDEIQINKPYEQFLPTVTFHFDKPLESVDINLLQTELADEFGSIVEIERGSLIAKLVIIKEFFTGGKKGFFKRIKEKSKMLIEKVKAKFQTALGKSIVGSLVEPPKCTIPDEKIIQNIYNTSSSNILQNFSDLDEDELDDIEYEVAQIAQTEDCKKNLHFILDNKPLYDKCEKQLRDDVKASSYEMTFVGHSAIMMRFNDEYDEIKNKIPISQRTEKFLYHGSKIQNHYGIVNSSLYNPNEDSKNGIKVTDDGYYGKGTYATENFFYACYYANKLQFLKPGEKCSILLCKAVYNNNYVCEKTKLEMGSQIGQNIKSHYGINHAVVGSESHFFPVSQSEANSHRVVAQEFVFPHKHQIIPLFSFTIMRRDYCMIWKDEHIDNNENSGYVKQLSDAIEVNIYFTKSVEEASGIIERKKKNKIKLITNGGGPDKTGQKLIRAARNIVGSDFVCLVFAGDRHHLDWVKTMPNVLFTTNTDMFKKFASLEMKEDPIVKFIDELQKVEAVEFNIKKGDLLRFPKVDL